MFKTGKFKNKNVVTVCPKTTTLYKKTNDERYTGSFWGYQNISTSSIKCITFHGTTFDLKQNLQPDLYRYISTTLSRQMLISLVVFCTILLTFGFFLYFANVCDLCKHF